MYLKRTVIINFFAFFLCISLAIQGTFSSYCYPDYCRNATFNFTLEPHEKCAVERVQRGAECMEMRFESLGHMPPNGQQLAQVFFKAYVRNWGGFNGKSTAFNFSVTNVNFNRLITRYQNLGNEETSVCRNVRFYGNLTHFPLEEFYVSCPFSDNTFESSPYRLEYLISGDSYEYSRKFVFIVPNHRFIDEIVRDVAMYTPFIYVDVSDASTLTLYIQSLPERFNVTSYKVWMINSLKNTTKEIILINQNKDQLIHHNFSVDEGLIYFKVAALHSICSDDGCKNSTSPYISIKQNSHKILIMIISIVWIPPVILYALYQTYKIYKKQEKLNRLERKPKCLLVYTPSHMAHVNAMIDLASYLRCCSIHAMIDTLDIPESPDKNPVLWCNEAFHSADVVIVATSPQTDEIAPVVYRNMDSQALRLLRENYPRRNKRYYALQFPYCKADDIPKEAKQFKRFSMPEDLDKLVRTIHEVEQLRIHKVFIASDKNFVDSVKLAKLQIVPTEKNFRSTEKNDELLLPGLKEENIDLEEVPLKEFKLKNENSLASKIVPKNFKTNIEELNLLGEVNEGDVEISGLNLPTSNCKIRIDSLNL